MKGRMKEKRKRSDDENKKRVFRILNLYLEKGG